MPVSPEESPQNGHSPWPFFLAFLGAAGVFSLLPRVVRRGFRRFVFAIFFEIAVAALAGLLAEKTLGLVVRESDEEYSPSPSRRR